MNDNIEITTGLNLDASKKFTLDLNEKTLTSSATTNGWITSQGELEIRNGSLVSDGTAVWAKGGKLTLIDCDITEEGTTGGDGVYVSDGADVVIRGGSIKATGENADSDDVWYGIGVVGGKVTVNTIVEGFHGGITAHGTSELVIEGGQYSGTYWHGLNINGIEVTLNKSAQFYGKSGDIQVYINAAEINNVNFSAGIYTQDQVYSEI